MRSTAKNSKNILLITYVKCDCKSQNTSVDRVSFVPVLLLLASFVCFPPKHHVLFALAVIGNCKVADDVWVGWLLGLELVIPIHYASHVGNHHHQIKAERAVHCRITFCFDRTNLLCNVPRTAVLLVERNQSLAPLAL